MFLVQTRKPGGFGALVNAVASVQTGSKLWPLTGGARRWLASSRRGSDSNATQAAQQTAQESPPAREAANSTDAPAQQPDVLQAQLTEAVQSLRSRCCAALLCSPPCTAPMRRAQQCAQGRNVAASRRDPGDAAKAGARLVAVIA